MEITGDRALKEAAIRTAETTVPEDIGEPLRAELISSLASQIAIGVAQERMQNLPRIGELRVLPGGNTAA